MRRGTEPDDAPLSPDVETGDEPLMYEPTDEERLGYGDIGQYGDPTTDPDVLAAGGLPGGDAAGLDRVAERTGDDSALPRDGQR